MKGGPRLAVFDTFKTKGGELTGEATRQRAIIAILAGRANPAERTRTGISKRMVRGDESAWKNVYSGIFRDMDEVLLPMGLAEEGGRLPLKRGPKALQEKGIPFYRLTRSGMLVALATGGGDGPALLESFFAGAGPGEAAPREALAGLIGSSPLFARSIFERYVRAFCGGAFPDLLPLDLSKLGGAPDPSLEVHREILGAFAAMSDAERGAALGLLDSMMPAGAKH